MVSGDLRSLHGRQTTLVRGPVGIFDHVVVSIAGKSGKTPLFTLEQRVDLARACWPTCRK